MGMAPDRRDIVNRAKALYPTPWREAHRTELGPDRATAFAKIVARLLWETDPRFGLNGKRGEVTDLSMDACAFISAAPVAQQAGGVEIIDYISAAGSASATVVWNDVTQETVNAGTIGVWVQPPPLPGSSGPPPDSDAPPDRRAVVERLDRDAPGLKRRNGGHAFTERVARVLAAEDARWGRFRTPNGDKTRDKLGWRQDGAVSVVDIIAGAGGPTPSVGWTPLGGQPGTWIAVPADASGAPPTPPPSTSLEARVTALEQRVAALERQGGS